ncbi:hypothetical protein K443DRAFT_14210 [Laccaria amethystina LaAM-08-1]|uniref:Uncharacterized protein n=1 Tax=Laccaria amethystina LaAM-08-1 TaxID=1095629 RepID=A0A0C9WTM5_9AGAR|nr:hypothetical protein K443DRAFT_14210 [Laccaria amethystina LaAM-08-1]
MPPNASRPCASSPLPPSASSHVEGDPPNDPPGPMDVAYWKRMYQALHRESNTFKKASKRKGERTASISQLGRGIRKVVFICGDIRDLVLEADKHIEFLDDPDALTDDFDGLNEEQVEALKRNWERSHKALQELCRLIPNFQKKIDEAEPEELSEYYAQKSPAPDRCQQCT